MKVSIITTCLNREATIRGSIESVLSQTYPDIEYIVVDGKSQDGSLKIINEYKDRIHHIVCEADNGMYEAINKGLRLATGDIVGFLHSDDVFYSKDTISRIVKEFENRDIEYVYGNGLYVTFGMDQVVRDWVSGEFDKEKLKHGWLPLHTTVFVKRHIFDRVGYYNEKYKIASDSDWQVRCLYLNDTKVSYIDEYIVRMRMGGISTSFRLTMRKWREDLQLFSEAGLNPYFSLTYKVISKMPQFVYAKLKNKLMSFL